MIGERQRRRHHNAVARMDTHGINIFHGADRDGIARAVAHGFKLDFFPARDALFHQNLRNGRGVQPGFGDHAQFCFVHGNPAAGAAQRKRRAHDNRISDLLRRRKRGLKILRDLRGHAGLADGAHRIPEQFSVLRLVDGVDSAAQQPHAVFRQHAAFVELHGQRQSRLAAKTRQKTVGTLFLDDARHRLLIQRFQIDFIRQMLVRHNGGGIGVDQHHVDALIPKHAAGLRARVVKLRRLSDDNRAGTDDHYLANG